MTEHNEETWAVAARHADGSYGVFPGTYSANWRAWGVARERRAEKPFIDFVAVRITPSWLAEDRT